MRIPRLPPLLLLCLGLAVLAVACGGDEAPRPRPQDGQYDNPTVRYRFEYPQDWADVSDKVGLSVREGDPDLVDSVAVGKFDEATGFFDGVLVFVVRINETVNDSNRDRHLDELDQAFRRQAELIGALMATPTTVELGGLKARQYIAEFVFGGAAQVQAASAQTVTFFGDRQYTVNCQGRQSTFDEVVLRGCEQVLQSFRFR